MYKTYWTYGGKIEKKCKSVDGVKGPLLKYIIINNFLSEQTLRDQEHNIGEKVNHTFLKP